MSFIVKLIVEILGWLFSSGVMDDTFEDGAVDSDYESDLRDRVRDARDKGELPPSGHAG